jgi:nucleotide-binding universal stress UspA family protein
MTILCGTDFSPHAAQAVRVAGLIARGSGQRLHLVHVLPAGVSHPAGDSPPDETGRARQRLASEAELMAPAGFQMDTEVLNGRPDEVLVESARQLHASLIVVGAVGHHAIDRWLVGSCAERTAREAPVPALVVREARPFEEWLVNGRTFRVVVGCEAGPSSDAALAWAGTLGKIGAIELIVTRLVFPGEENRRVGAAGPGMGVTLSPAAEAGLLEELRGRTTSLLGDVKARLKVIPGLGRIDRHLVIAAEELGGDLVVVGSHQREGFRRWWHGSVSSGVLHAAPMSVAVVPVRPPGGPGSDPWNGPVSG